MSFFITAGSGFRSGSSKSGTGTNNNLTQMQRGVMNNSQPKNSRMFAIDPYDYKPTRLGLRQQHKAIVIEYSLKSSGKRYLHNIKVGKYTDPMSFGISVSRSGSFAEALTKEIESVVDKIYADHCEYLPPEKITRAQVESLVNEIMVYNQSKRRERQKGWNEVQSTSLDNRRGGGRDKKQSQTRSTMSQSKEGTASKTNSMSPATRQMQTASPQIMAQNQGSFFGKRGSNTQPEEVPGQGQIQANLGYNDLSASKKGKKKKKKKKRPTSQTKQGKDSMMPHLLPDGNISSSGNKFSASASDWMQDSYDVTGSKSLTDLADLPVVGQQKKVQAAAAVKGFDDSGFDDWDFDDVEESGKSIKNNNKFNNSSSPPRQSNWSPPKPQGKLYDQRNQQLSSQPPIQNRWQPPSATQNDPLKNQAPATNVKKPAEPAKSEPWKPKSKLGANRKPAQQTTAIDTTKVDYNKLDLNKLDDQTLQAHKKAMDVDYNKNFVGANDPSFKYDVRKNFSRNKNAVLEDDSWDDDE